MMAAITAKEQGDEVVILEKMKTLGRKLLITGKGRCNLTNGVEISEFIKNIPGNGMFLYSSFKNYTNEDLKSFFENNGVKLKEERGARIFPTSDKSMDILNALIKRIKQLKIEIRTETAVKKIIVENNKCVGVMYGQTEIKCDKIILATGGMSYPATGSTGDGYKFAKELGHKITELKPSLVPLECKEKDIVKELQGLSLKNVSIKLQKQNKIIYEDFGEMIFTHFGVSGPVILSGSAHLVKMPIEDVKLSIDLKPALDLDKLDKRILRDFEIMKNKQFKNSLDELLPNKLIGIIIKLSKINPLKQVNEITKEERQTLVYLLKNFELTITKFRPIEEAIITAGGINIKEIDPKTMESKIVKGLYFAGEIIDVDAYTGGFNLQIAFSTGYMAGNKTF